MQTLTANVLPISEQIVQVCDKYPNSIALSHDNQRLSYEELDRRADRFAGYLAQLGVVSGGSAAICMERSFDWIVAALGIMRAGAAYVALDSSWPDSRLRFAVEDSGANILVARTALLDRLRVKARGVDPTRDADAIAVAPDVASRPVEPGSLAYIVYTSGSTGVPKGVEITHANLAHLIRWHRDTFGVTRGDRASHLAGLGFDAAAWEIWPNLAAGATLCLANNTVRSSPDLIRRWMIHERVTIGFVPTLHAAPMMAMEWPSTTPLRFLLTGGDVLHHGQTVQLPFDVVNNYGPTECTVVSTYSILKPGSHEPPPIGRPITGSTIYLLTEDHQQVPDGTIGEIYIGGSGVGRGYRNLPDPTERNFLPDPFIGVPSSRMYRTGDRGVRRPDGEIEFCGRLDRQRKIRGQRVELDEIASVLAQHPNIDFATAISSTSQAGENQIVAYILPRENAPVPTAHELHKHLLRILPDYMIPAAFVRLSASPLSPNGKLDLAMLAQPTDANLLEGIAAKGIATPIEEKLLKMMKELLETDVLATEDSFFLAGGHSLLGMQLVMRLRKTFGVDLSLQQLFEAPTVKRLALLIETMLEEDGPALSLVGREQATPARRRAEDKPTLPDGIFGPQISGTRQSIFWVHDPSVELAKVIGEIQPFFSVLLTHEDFLSLGEAPTLQSVAGCLLRKIKAAQSTGPYTIGGFCLGGLLAYEIASQLRATGNEVSLLVLLDAPNPAYIESCDSLTRKASYVRYALKRAARLGPRRSFGRFRDHLRDHLVRTKGPKSAETKMRVALQSAALAFRPEKYEGKVLLILASEHPPYVNLLPGWQKVVARDLNTYYVEGHHDDLLKGRSMRSVADQIVSHLTHSTDDNLLSLSAGARSSPFPVREENPARP
jgi:amino acid adenylation domain-containing protein